MGAFKKNLLGKGAGNPKDLKIKDVNTLIGADPYHGKIMIYKKDRYLLGAAGFKDEDRRETLLNNFWNLAHNDDSRE